MQQAPVSALVCPLMSAPSPECERADEALTGWMLELLDQPRPGWYRVHTHYGYTGYAPADCLCLGEGCAAHWSGLDKAVVVRSFCDVLSAPAVEAWPLATLARGAFVAPVGAAGEKGWQRVALPDGREGYTKRGFLEPYGGAPRFSGEELRRAVVDSARSYLGTHYRWGGKTPMGIDCSGLSFMSYFLNGVTIFRDARMAEGFPVCPISLEQARPADLLYFPGHVAIYLGGGTFIHSTAREGSDGVVISSLIPGGPDYRPDLRESLCAVGSIFAGQRYEM